MYIRKGRGYKIVRLSSPDWYGVVRDGCNQAFNIHSLAGRLSEGQEYAYCAGRTVREHVSLILLAMCAGVI